MVGTFLRWRQTLYTDKAGRPWFEAYGRMKGRWWLLVCTWDQHKLMRVLTRVVAREDNPIRQSKMVQRKFYEKIWFKEHDQWRRSSRTRTLKASSKRSSSRKSS